MELGPIGYNGGSVMISEDMTSAMTTQLDRTNEEWLADLRSTQGQQPAAIDDLRERVKRSIYYYLSQERSDLRDLAQKELVTMAEDLAQDAVLRVMDNLDNFRGESRFTTWANKIAVRLAISELRRARYKDFSLDDLTADGDFLSAEASIVGEAPPNPETAAERDDVIARIDAAMKEALTDRQYRALVAVALRGVPMDIVAEQLDTNRNALYKLIYDARRNLKNYMESQGLSTDYMLDLFQR
ncbi:sigma-70 family RNA polymerase sigma factor [Phototrophicus methaneseepsis]|uniref:Sigma-70 family RNA polymerase sigma factor n=1 Tax=Phototrophicus methaneseepsis TaxID=2710758 RepID=A0A7S8IEJ6_9CHLR|nr:sigma-70 family RNA polymerase sigma factor [Phototrophicus methaneseepsis]QPC82666.1 sigma-70 family RNA polymerase sigma factor [Phototrophicus methaneseepsis]